MIPIFDHIAQRSLQASQAPLFMHLKVSECDAYEKLGFVPWAAHFAMTFADLHEFFGSTEPACDEYEKAANVNLFEDVTHWNWYLTDLITLGLDPQLRFTQALRFIWSAQTAATRRFTYEMCKLCAKLRSLERLVMVNALEATGRVMFQAVSPVREQVEARAGRRLQYFGKLHLDTERKHTLEDETLRASLARITLDDSTRGKLLAIVDHVFEYFLAFADGLLRVLQRQRPFADEFSEESALRQDNV